MSRLGRNFLYTLIGLILAADRAARPSAGGFFIAPCRRWREHIKSRIEERSHGAARRKRGAAHSRAIPRRPMRRAGLRDGAGPTLANGFGAPRGERKTFRNYRAARHWKLIETFGGWD